MFFIRKIKIKKLCMKNIILKFAVVIMIIVFMALMFIGGSMKRINGGNVKSHRAQQYENIYQMK